MKKYTITIQERIINNHEFEIELNNSVDIDDVYNYIEQMDSIDDVYDIIENKYNGSIDQIGECFEDTEYEVYDVDEEDDEDYE